MGTTADAAKLDTWVFDRFEEFMAEAERNDTLASQLKQDRVVLFFHLLGLDTNGHAHRPNSPEYLGNIAVVDAGVRYITDRLDAFFGADGRTAFVLTADHGMSHRGNHGDGHPDNTMTPLIAWGAGVAGPEKVAGTQEAEGGAGRRTKRKKKRQAAVSDGAPAASVASAGRPDAQGALAETADPYAAVPWGLDDLVRRDVNQADIAPLMSVLIGVPYPMNSVGELPLAYLSAPPAFKAAAALANARQILAQFLVKHDSARRASLFAFRPFAPLATPATRHADLLAEADELAAAGAHAAASARARHIATLAIEGLRYYQTYDWLFLRSIVVAGYLAWMLHCLLFLLKSFVAPPSPPVPPPLAASEPAEKSPSPVRPPAANPRAAAARAAAVAASGKTVRFKAAEEPFMLSDSMIDRAAVAVFAGFALLLLAKRASYTYHLYVSFMVYLWAQVAKDRRYLALLLPTGFIRSPDWWLAAAKCAAYLAALMLLVYTYFRREVLSLCLIAAGLAWPETTPAHFQRKNWAVCLGWRFSCVVLSVFTLLPVEHVEDMRLVNLGAFMVLLSGGLAAYLLPRYAPTHSLPGSASPRSRVPLVVLFQLLLVVLSTVVVNDTAARLAAKKGLPPLNQFAAWAILATTLAVPIADARAGSPRHHVRALVVVFLAFAPVFILLSLSYETIFYVCFAHTLFAWVVMERQIYNEIDLPKTRTHVSLLAKKDDDAALRPAAVYRAPTVNDLWSVTLFLFLTNEGFFGTGNIASVSSFSLASVYRFSTGFAPFLMAALLVLKLLVPLFALAAAQAA
ncbi:Glycosyl phosphatidyl inositol anchor synthesis, partial [Cladochytrium tenue]